MSEATDVSAVDTSECVSRECPAGATAPEDGSLRVSIGRRAYDQIRKHAAEDTEHEICGVLLGELCKDEAGPWLHITEIIRGEHTASQGAQVTITHETWNHFHKIKDNQFPEKRYLGWYHSHPDFGVFLSAMDLFIHENFFNAAHQVALVVDPQRGEEGLFCWREGKPEQAASFWVGSDEHKYEPGDEPSAEQLALRDVEKKLDRLQLSVRDLTEAVRNGPEGGWMQSVLLIGILLLLGAMAVKDFMRRDPSPRQEDLFDQARRKMVSIYEDPGGKGVVVRYELPPEAWLIDGPSRDPMLGRTFYGYRVPTDKFVLLYLPHIAQRALAEEAKRREREKEDEKGKESGKSQPEGAGEGSAKGK